MPGHWVSFTFSVGIMVAFSEQGKAGSFTALAALAFALAFGLLALAFITRPLAWRFMTFFIESTLEHQGFQMFKQMPQLLLAIVFILVAGFCSSNNSNNNNNNNTNSKSNTNSWGCCSDSGLSMSLLSHEENSFGRCHNVIQAPTGFHSTQWCALIFWTCGETTWDSTP